MDMCTAGEDKHDFFRRFIYHKVNQKVSIGDALRSMELAFGLAGNLAGMGKEKRHKRETKVY